MANSYSDPLRPARPGRIDAQVHPTPTYHGESLVPDYSKWMPGLADYDRLQRNRAAGVPVGQYGPAFPPVPQPAPATAQQPAAPAPTPSAINDGARRFFPNAGYNGVGTSLTPSPAAPSPSAPGITPGVKPPALPDGFPGAAAGNALAPAPVTPHLIEGMPSSQWFKQQAQRTQQSNRYATCDPQADAPHDDDDDGLDARAMHAGATFTGRPHFTREQLAKMDAASLAALALWPRAPEMRRQWRMNPASLPKLKQENPTRAQALAARALRPRFGPGGSSSTSVPPFTRSGTRSTAELAKLDPATLAALALQPRAPHMMRRRAAGLNAGALNAPGDPNAKPLENNAAPPVPSPAWTPPSLPDPAFSTDPQNYFQPTAPNSNGENHLPPTASQLWNFPPQQTNPQSSMQNGIANDPNAPTGWHHNDISSNPSQLHVAGHFKPMAPGDPAGWRSDPARTSLAPSTGVQLSPDGLLTPPGKKFESWANHREPATGELISPSDRKTDALDYHLHVKPPQTLSDLGQARQEEISSSPTSAAYAAKLAQVAKDTGYTVNWQLNPDPKSHSSTTIPDHAHKQINISISQNDLAGGTFGHESDHAIRMMLEGQAMKESPPPRHPSSPEYAAYMKGIKDKVASDPFFQNNSTLDSRNDAMENQGTRVGNLIIAERLAQNQLDNNGVPLSERARLPNSGMVPAQRLMNNNIKSKHENNRLPLPDGTVFGTHGLDVLRQKWQDDYRKIYPDR